MGFDEAGLEEGMCKGGGGMLDVEGGGSSPSPPLPSPPSLPTRHNRSRGHARQFPRPSPPPRCHLSSHRRTAGGLGT